MAPRYQIHPALGIARVGNSPDSFYLAPETIGGLPIECDDRGTPTVKRGRPVLVSQFKDPEGRIRRQAALFRVFAYDDAKPGRPPREITLDDAGVESIEWTVHLANKKGAWYINQELDGDLMLGKHNSYAKRKVPLRNANVVGEAKRRALIIDPGPRTVSRPGQHAEFSRLDKTGYRHVSFPKPGLDPHDVETLGRAMMNRAGHLAVLGGFGRAGGLELISTYTGADSWYDDTSDGPVTCRLTLKGQKKPIELTAWVMIGPPKYAPELRNIVTLDDVMYDLAVRHENLVPDLFDATKRKWPGGWNPRYIANYERDIKPILDRIGDYQWVANVPTMAAFARPRFDPADASAANRANRENYVRYFRRPGLTEIGDQHEVLMASNGVPLMPVNSGTNSVTNDEVDKFMSVTLTQYKLLKQWAAGKFVNTPSAGRAPGVHPLDHASAGNCVGHPMSPGVETSWNMRNPAVYDPPYRIRHRAGEAYYAQHGLSPGRDECEGGGCEPGDLTKRMSPPWQSDLYQCSVEWINFTLPGNNYVNPSGMPEPPSFFAYWWPPQAPMYVMSGDMTPEEQAASGVTAGQQVTFLRGLDNISRVVLGWHYAGFILNQNTGPDRVEYPSFVERERNHDKFVVSSVAVGQAANQMAASGIFLPEDNYFVPVWYLRHDPKEDPTGRLTRAGLRRKHRGF
ncbi:MAG TPA: CTQ-dependent lysine 6-oxidase LodA [Vicinamibacterales bacterium]|nr:CTQ-dependent lysine 6-oxidase LodA [Vicinamibacterales bacterium]